MIQVIFHNIDDKEPKEGDKVIVMSAFNEDKLMEGTVYRDMILMDNRTPLGFEYIKYWAINNLRYDTED